MSKAKLLPLCRLWILVLVACVMIVTAVFGIVDVSTDLFNLVLVPPLLSLLLLIVVIIVVLLPHRLY
jgi:hypothetical protein